MPGLPKPIDQPPFPVSMIDRYGVARMVWGRAVVEDHRSAVQVEVFELFCSHGGRGNHAVHLETLQPLQRRANLRDVIDGDQQDASAPPGNLGGDLHHDLWIVKTGHGRQDQANEVGAPRNQPPGNGVGTIAKGARRLQDALAGFDRDAAAGRKGATYRRLGHTRELGHVIAGRAP